MATSTKKEKAPVAAPKAAQPVAAVRSRREVVGVVVSDKMAKTIVVKVDRSVRHGLYGKYVTRSRRFKAHDEKNDAKVGDLVRLVESKPLSRDKRWALQVVVRRGGQAPEAQV
jgi:small subunit ribosomal protein S17